MTSASAASRAEQRFDPKFATNGDTQGASILVEALGAQDVSQGSEEENKNPEIREMIGRDTMITPSGPYNGDPGGSIFVRENLAKNYWDSFRINVHPEQTFAFQTLGRSVIEEAYKIAGESVLRRDFDGAVDITLRRPDPFILLEDLGWGILDNLAKDNRLNVGKFEHFSEDLVQEIESKIMQYGPENIAAIVMNRPHNPTGKEIGVEETRRFMQMMDRINEKFGTDIHVIFDVPYVFGCDVGEDEHGPYLKTGLENVLNENWKTKWVVCNTMGKELALAAHGMANVACSPTYPIERLIKRTVNNGKGIARNDQFVINAADYLGNDNYSALKWQNRSELHDKYVAGSRALAGLLPNNMLPGGPNMLLETAQFNRCDFEGRVFDGRYGKWTIGESGNVTRDLVTCLGHEFNVVPVAQPFLNAAFDNSIFLRFAKKMTPDRLIPAIEDAHKGLCAISGKSSSELGRLVDGRTLVAT